MKKHRSFKPEQKAHAVLQVLTGQKSAAQICRELQISESLLSRWKKQFLDGASSVFEKESNPAQDDQRVAELERLVGRLTLELEASKSLAALGLSHEQKREVMMKLKSDYPIKMFCDLLALPRSSWYYRP